MPGLLITDSIHQKGTLEAASRQVIASKNPRPRSGPCSFRSGTAFVGTRLRAARQTRFAELESRNGIHGP
jgi:hypothetical protein